LSAIFISGVTATPGNVNIIAIEKVIPENIWIAVKSFVFICLFYRSFFGVVTTVLETK